MRLRHLIGLALLPAFSVGCGDVDSLGLNTEGSRRGDGGAGVDGGSASSGAGNGATSGSGNDPVSGTGSNGSVSGNSGSANGSASAGSSNGTTNGSASAGNSTGTTNGSTSAGSGSANGSASAGSGSSGGLDGGAYDPCAGKACGDNCSLCAPDDPDCFETAEIKYCDAAGICSGTAPKCSGLECHDGSDCPAPAGPCEICDDGSAACPTADCVEGQCRVSYPSCGDGGTSCVVDGKTYPSGTSGVPDPTSCNTCTCHDGELTVCTEAHCPEPCPDGTEYGSVCASCGPAGGCTAMHIGCLETCSSSEQCGGSTPFCFEGVCGVGPCL